MPSGKRIDWSQYDSLLQQHLPGLTIEAWRSKYAPTIGTKAIAADIPKNPSVIFYIPLLLYHCNEIITPIPTPPAIDIIPIKAIKSP